MDNWYYVGTCGQLGPLERSDVDELIACGAISRETYVWRQGMGDWQPAGSVGELAGSFGLSTSVLPSMSSPPPTPIGARRSLSRPPALTSNEIQRLRFSPKSRVLAGVLNLFLPGVGRLYLGDVGIGVCQLLLGWFTCIGHLWSFIDGLIMLTGGELRDGDGRPVPR